IAPIARDVVINGMKDGVIILDSDRRIVDINPAGQQIVARLSNIEPIGRSILDFFSPWPELIERYQRMEVDDAEDEITRGDGDSQRWYELHLSTLRDENHLVLGQVIIIHDISR